MRVVAGNQLSLDWEPSVRQRFQTLRQCVHFVALEYPQGIKSLAADCDLSMSELTRRLAPTEGDPRSCDVDLMVKIMQVTQSRLPLHWLIGEFVPDQSTRVDLALQTVEALIPHLSGAVHVLQQARAKKEPRR